MKDRKDLKTQRKIYELIEKNPGLHTSRIAEILNISWELANYHLNYLEKHDLINITKEEGYNRCFPSGKIGEKDRKIIGLLRQKYPLTIVLFLLTNPYSRFKEIAENVDIAPSTLVHHMKKLEKLQIIEFEEIKNAKRYIIVNKKYIIQLLIKYKPHSFIEDYEDMWKEFLWTKDLFKENK